jgi:hypothetical protein
LNRTPLAALFFAALTSAQGEHKYAFEAASIKPSATTDNSSRYNTDAGQMTASNWTLRN